MKMPCFREMEVSVAFYRDSHDIYTKIYQLISFQKITHCGIVFGDKNNKYINLMNQGRGSRFIKYSTFEKILQKKYPDILKKLRIVSLGTAPVSVSQLDNYANNRHLRLSPFRENVFWWLIGRHFTKTYYAMTCALATSQMLKLCGFDNKLHVGPRELYEELTDGINNYFRAS